MEPSGFIADGYTRAFEALHPEISATVRAEYAARLEDASASDRLRLDREIEREIQRRIHEKAPPDALY